MYQLYTIKGAGQIGVDIFLFLSAVGLFFSLSKDKNLKSFYYRRFIRIIPAYFIVFFIWDFFFLRENIIVVFQNALGISLFKNGYLSNWYFVLIIYLYLVYPFIFKAHRKYGVMTELLLIGIVLIFNYLFKIYYPDIFNNAEIALRRIPVFLMGSAIAEYVYNKKEVNIFIVIISFVVMIVTLLFAKQEWNMSLSIYRYICGVNAISMIIFLSYVYSLSQSKKIFSHLYSIIKTCGMYSLEIYLLYEKVITVLRMYMDDNQKLAIALLAAVISACLAVLLKCISSLFVMKKSNI